MQVPPDIIILFNYMNARCFSQHPGLLFSCVGSCQHNPVISNLPCHLPLCHHCSSVSQAPCALSPGGPLPTLPHNLSSFLCQAVGHISPQQFPPLVFQACSQTRFLTARSKSPAPVFLSRLLQSTYLCHVHKQRPGPFLLTIWGPGGK